MERTSHFFLRNGASSPQNYFVLSIICKKSAFNEHPPTKKPSIFGLAKSAFELAGFTEPPYIMRSAFAISSPSLPAIHCLRFACTSSACSGVAVSPVPIAQTGSYATTIFPQASFGKDSTKRFK